jgi:hypothetical protein
MQDKREMIEMIQSIFDECTLKVSDNLIWIMRGSVTLHILDINTLIYYFETNQLNNYLKEL